MPERMPIRAVVLDVNNTLIDAFSAFAAIDIAFAHDAFGITLTRERVRDLWGSTPDIVYHSLFQQHHRPWQQVAEQFRQYRQDHSDVDAFHPQVYPETLPTLTRLKAAGMVLCLATGGTPSVLYEDLERAGIVPGDWFDHIQFPIGDDPKPLTRVAVNLARQGIRAPEMVMVGDDNADRQATLRAGLGRFIAVTTGPTMSREDFLRAGVPPRDIAAHIGQVPGLILPPAVV